MKNWSYVFIFFYCLLIAALIPIFNIFEQGTKYVFFEEYSKLWFWVVLGIIILIEVLLFVVPVKIAKKRPITQRSLLVPIITIALLFSVLFVLFVFDIGAAISGDWFLKLIPGDGFALLIAMLLLWGIWFFIFFKASKKEKPEGFSKKIIIWLIKGSVLEMLVAIPSHIIVRQRDECCAPILTFMGIVTGISLMLLSFGPGIFFLYAERIKRKKPQKDA